MGAETTRRTRKALLDAERARAVQILDGSIDRWVQGRQEQVIGLIRTRFLKRLGSPVAAFELSRDRVLHAPTGLAGFVLANGSTSSNQSREEAIRLAARHGRLAHA